MAKKPAAAAKEQAPPEGKRVPKEVHIRLTPQQCAQKSDQASTINREKTDLQKEFEEEEKLWKQKRADYKNRVKNLQEQVDKLLAEVKAKAAVSTEQVILVLNHDSGAAEYHFQQPGGKWEIVDTRPLEENERQTTFIKDKVDSMPQSGQEVTA